MTGVKRWIRPIRRKLRYACSKKLTVSNPSVFFLWLIRFV
jgi:hypothetical protein